MANTQTIYVTNLFDLEQHVRDLEPTHLVSIIQPELQPAAQVGINASQHLRIAVHDIVASEPHGVLASYRDIEQLVEFADAWNPSAGALMTHCYAGVSRSTAAALIAAVLKNDDAEACGRALRDAAPHAQPNRHIIALADEIMGATGKLKAAHRAMGPASTLVASGPLTTLLVDGL